MGEGSGAVSSFNHDPDRPGEVRILGDEPTPLPSALADARRRDAGARSDLEELCGRLTMHASRKAELVGGASLVLFVRDDPGAGPLSGYEERLYPDPSTEDLLEVLGYVYEVRRGVDHDERRLIAGARRRGATWQEIAGALGLKSRQAARQRYARLGGKPAELDKQIENGEASNGD